MTLRLLPDRRARTTTRLDLGPGWVPTLDPRDLDPAPITSHAVRLYTPSQVLVGTVRCQGRLSDILNQRGELRLEDATIRELGFPAEEALAVPAATVDAFDVDVAMASPLPDEAWTRARRVHKVRYPTRIDAGDYRIEGWLHVFPGIDPQNHACGPYGNLFLPVTGATVRRLGHMVSDPSIDVVLVNRRLIRSVAQADMDVAQDAAGAILRRRAPSPA